ACSKALFYGAFSKPFYYGGEGGIPVQIALFFSKIKDLGRRPSHPREARYHGFLCESFPRRPLRRGNKPSAREARFQKKQEFNFDLRFRSAQRSDRASEQCCG